MKILYLHQFFNTPKMPGSTRSYEFAKRLVERGDKVYMITTNWQGLSDSSYTLVDGIHVFWAPIRYENKMSYYKRIFIFLGYIWHVISIGRKLDYDLIIATSTPLTIAIPALILKKIKAVKMIFEIRDLWPQLPIAIGAIKSNIIIKLLRFLEKTIYNESNHIICLSPGMKTELISDNLLDKISVVTNFSDIARFQNHKKSFDLLNDKIDFDKNSLIVYTGSFGRINEVIYLVNIANELKTINSKIFFLLAGDGFEKDLIISKSKEYNILNKTFYCIDYIPKNQMPGLLSRATITASIFKNIPEMTNNSANKFFDGLAAGKPIMINYDGWQADLLNESGAGFIIPPNNPKSAANLINELITNKSRLKEMSYKSKKLAYQFDVNSNYKKFAKVIDHVSTL